MFPPRITAVQERSEGYGQDLPPSSARNRRRGGGNPPAESTMAGIMALPIPARDVCCPRTGRPEGNSRCGTVRRGFREGPRTRRHRNAPGAQRGYARHRSPRRLGESGSGQMWGGMNTGATDIAPGHPGTRSTEERRMRTGRRDSSRFLDEEGWELIAPKNPSHERGSQSDARVADRIKAGRQAGGGRRPRGSSAESAVAPRIFRPSLGAIIASNLSLKAGTDRSPHRSRVPGSGT